MKKSAPQFHPEVENIAACYDPIKDWRMDPAGYFLIRINPVTKQLQAGLCRKDNVIEKTVSGKTAEEVYNTMLRYVTLLPVHAAYLGKELAKAQIACDLGVPYVQDDPLDVTSMRTRQASSPLLSSET